MKELSITVSELKRIFGEAKLAESLADSKVKLEDFDDNQLVFLPTTLTIRQDKLTLG